jgi:hypothetical protein
METLVATQVSFNEAAIAALAIGVSLGVLLAVIDAGTAFAQKKLQIKDDELLKYLAVYAAVGTVVMLICLAAFVLWEPSTAVRQDILKNIFDRNIEVLGLGGFYVLALIGSIPVHLLKRFILVFLRK